MIKNLLKNLYSFIFETSGGTMLYATLMFVAGLIGATSSNFLVLFIFVAVGYFGGFALWAAGRKGWRE